MPYKRVGTVIYVQRNRHWKVLRRHKTVDEAKKHLIALQINVGKHK
jgi:hypothetical protein